MLKRNAWKFLSITLGAGVLITTSAITIPLLMRDKNNPNDFDPVYFDGHNFNSKEELLAYIQNNSEKLEKDAKQKIFTVSMGGDQISFDEYSSALKYVEKHLQNIEVYLKPDQVQDLENFTIGAEQFVKKDNAQKYVIFPKYSDNNTTHSYTFAKDHKEKAKGPETEEEKEAIDQGIAAAREEAALSYLQIHSAYKFNDIYFHTLGEVRQYINDYWWDRENFDNKKRVKKEYKGLFLENNQVIVFDKDLDEKALAKDEDFKNQVANHASPFYKYEDSNGETKFLRLTQNVVSDLADLIDDTNVNYIKVDSNGDTITQVVDMSSETPNGSIYGNYFFSN